MQKPKDSSSSGDAEKKSEVKVRHGADQTSAKPKSDVEKTKE